MCVSEVRENKNLKGKYARDYREQMFKKTKYCFVEFYGLFRFMIRRLLMKKIKTYLKQERFDYFGQDRTNASDVGTYHHLVIDILKIMIEPCQICIQSRFVKAFNCEPVNLVTSDCSHVFCTTCFKNEKIVSIIIFIF